MGYAGGDGSEQYPFLIDDATDIDNLLRAQIQNGDNTYSYELINDIFLSSYNWEPLGASTSNGTAYSSFGGVLDGAGYKIHGLNSNVNVYYDSYDYSYSGLFAILNGATLHGGLKPYGATFLMFSDYARNALRMAALMKISNIFVYTHDSIGLGEDGPTHQAVEQIPTLRMIPNMSVWRPCDTVETAVSWRCAIESNDGPSILIFSRQSLAFQQRDAETIANIAKGGYVLKDTDGSPDAIVIATGSEVALAVEAAKASNKNVRVVSMPCVEKFEAQDDAYKESVLPKAVTARVAVEAAIMDGWWKYVGMNGAVVGMTSFGESAPAGQLFELFGFTVDNVVKTIDSVA